MSPKLLSLSAATFLFALSLPMGVSAQAISANETVSSPTKTYALQAGVFGVEANAVALREALAAEGYSPVTIVTDNGRWKVMLGAFSSRADAWLWREELKEVGREVVTVELHAQAQSDLTRSVDGQVGLISSKRAHSVFGLASAEGEARATTVQTLKGREDYERLEALDRPGNEKVYGEALLEALATAPQSDPLRGYILANLGSLDLKAGRYAEARERLGAVAKGVVPSAMAHRVMAMRRYAWIVHHEGDRIGALHAYREILGYTQSADVRATCEVEIAGLLFELAESGKGSHEEVRKQLSGAWQRIGAKDSKLDTVHATLELMFLETYARQPQPDYAKAAELGEAFVARWSALGADAPIRELGSAMYQTGMYHRRAGNDERALYWYQRVLNEIPEDAPSFASYHPHAQSLIGLAHLARGADNKELRDQISKDVLEAYPNDEISRRIRSARPDLARQATESSETSTPVPAPRE